MLKRIILRLILLVLVAAIFILFRTFSTESKQLTELEPLPADIRPGSLERFSQALQIKTVSPENKADFDSIQFQEFNSFLADSYPLIDSLLDHQTFNEFSHLYTWKGSNPDLKPAVLMGHLDVVPVIEENRKYWKENPFGGEVVQDTVWGRGAIDDKVSVIALMEAIEWLLEKDFEPERTYFIALGHDEEIGGLQGARVMAQHLEDRGVEAEFVLDEGGSITRDMIPGLGDDAALVGIAEKGFATLYLSLELEGGHSSMPEKETAIDVMAGAISRLKNNPLPAEISPALEAFIEYLGPEMPFVNRMAFANPWLFKPLIINAYEKSSSGNALVRTTTSPTIFNSGVKDNIIPLSARATVNFRILSESSVDEVVDHVKKVIDDDRIKIGQGAFNVNPSKVSDVNTSNFSGLHRTIAQAFPEAKVAPYLVVGATDSRHFKGVSDQIFRFSPIRISPANVKSFHGLNERIAVGDFHSSIQFYMQLIRNTHRELN
jgi:carboxypeptidase PM20D1